MIASRDPSILDALFARMFGKTAVHQIEGGVRLAVGAQAIEVLDTVIVTARWAMQRLWLQDAITTWPR